MRSPAAAAALVALLPLLPTAVLAQYGSQNITDDTYFYGQSPPVYPSPNAPADPTWASAYSQAKAFVAQLTDEEKVNLTTGIGYSASTTGCSGTIAAIPRMNFSGLCLNDAGNGLRGTDYVSGYPSGLHVGASWNRSLAYERGHEMGLEFYRAGVNIQLGPVVGPLGRIAEGGRNWEGFTNDPYLEGQLAYHAIQGGSSAGVGTCVKHFIAYEQELNRNPGTNAEGQNVESYSSNVDDKTMHELYLWPFQDAVLAGTVSVMCSYNRINNSYGCANSATQNGLLKTELGFQGFIVSDWGAQHAGVATANAGMDMVMPSSSMWGPNLTTAVQNGSVSEDRLNDMATRIMAAWYMQGQNNGFPEPGVGMPVAVALPHTAVEKRSASSRSILYTAAVEGHVLVKNDGILPLQSPKLVSLFGYDGAAQSISPLTDTGNVDPLSGIYANGTQTVAGGSGTNDPAFIVAPYDAFAMYAYQSEQPFSLLWDFSNTTMPIVDPTSDACFVFINAYATEGADRPNVYDEYSDTLVQNVANTCANTVVVIHNAGIRLVEAWIEHPNVTGLIYAHLPGQNSGAALVDIIMGRENPSGKLPYTVGMNVSNYGPLLNHSEPNGIYWLFPQSDFSEGVYNDYRAFDFFGITPRFEFGFGLSYSNFSYSNLNINMANNASMTPYPANDPIIQGGNPRLFDVLATVTATVTNTASMPGAEVAQLYLGIPNGPSRQLRGFDKVFLGANGGSDTVTFQLTRRDMSTWDTNAQQWLLQPGSYNVYVGASSRITPLTSTINIANSTGNGM